MSRIRQFQLTIIRHGAQRWNTRPSRFARRWRDWRSRRQLL